MTLQFQQCDYNMQDRRLTLCGAICWCYGWVSTILQRNNTTDHSPFSFVAVSLVDPGFPRGGCVNPWGGGHQHTILPIFQKTAWKWRNFGPGGGVPHIPRAPLSSATVKCPYWLKKTRVCLTWKTGSNRKTGRTGMNLKPSPWLASMIQH